MTAERASIGPLPWPLLDTNSANFTRQSKIDDPLAWVLLHVTDDGQVIGDCSLERGTRMTRLTAIGWLLGLVVIAPADEPKTLKLVQTIPLQGKAGRFDHLAIDPKGERLFVANLSNDSLDVIDLKAGKLVK